MTYQSIKTKNLGFTLIEMLVGLALFGTVALFIIGIVSKIYRSRTVGSQVEFMQGATASMVQLLTQDVRDADEVSIYQNSGMSQLYLTLTDQNDEKQEILYAVEEGILERDGEKVTPDTVKISHFQVENMQDNDLLPLLKIHFIIESAHYEISPVDKTVFLSLRRKELEE